MLEKIKCFFEKEWTREEKVLLLADILLAGILFGWITSPFKGGYFSNNTIGSQFYGGTSEVDENEEEAEEE